MPNALKELGRFGQSPWLDTIGRGLLRSGELARLIREDGLKGVTSNPTIFAGALSSGADYDEPLATHLAAGESDPERLYECLAFDDIRGAADLLRPVFESSRGADGFVSLEVSPALAYDAPGTLAAARRLFSEVGRPNCMIKVPATKEGLPAVEQLIAEGIPVNVTLIFSVERYEAVMNAYLSGLEKLAAQGRPLDQAASVASFFISRIDTAVDKQLKKLIAEGRSELQGLLGKAALAQGQAAYRKHQEVFARPRFQALKARGARVQRPLWASTGTKDPAYSDVLYIDGLIGPDTVNTMPPATWAAFRDHGKARKTLDKGGEALKTLEALGKAGVDMARVTRELEEAGVKAFIESFRQMVEGLAKKSKALDDRVIDRLWAKDAALWKSDAGHQRIIANSLGWLRMPEEMPSHCAELKAFADGAREAGFSKAVLLGMGGSSLAPEVLRRTFPAKKGGFELTVLDSTDPEAVLSADRENPPEKTLYVVASKSGTTTEPLRLFDYFWGRAQAALKEKAGAHFVAITDPGSFLEGQAGERGFRRVFQNFADIGGRFSALSYFGLVPAALLGLDLPVLLERAQAMALACRKKGRDNPGLRLGSQLAAYAAAGKDKVTLLMSPEVESLGLWLEQLVAESTGKEGQGVLPIACEPVSAASAYGPDRVFVLYSLKGSKSSAPQALADAVEKAGHPVLRLSMDDALDIGAEFFRWEVATAVLGRRLGIDPFDQPDVQSAKDKTKSVLDHRVKSGALPKVAADAQEQGFKVSFSAASKTAKAQGLDGSLQGFLSAVKPGDYVGLLPFVSPRGEYETEVQALAKALRAATPAAVQPGYGPRYLHSTGQMHKGGPDKGLFLVLAREDVPDAAIPGMPYGFADLVNAQALGDFQALDAAGRRAVLVRFTGDAKKALARIAQAVGAAAPRALPV